MIDLLDVERTARAGLCVGRREVIVKLFEVDAVVAQRVLADVTFVAQVFEELWQELVKHNERVRRVAVSATATVGSQAKLNATLDTTMPLYHFRQPSLRLRRARQIRAPRTRFVA